SAFVRFPWKRKERPRVIIASQEGLQLYRPKVVGLGTLAQIVTRGAAKQLLASSEQFDRPVDSFLQLTWIHGADVLSVWPSRVSEVSQDLGGSTIHRKPVGFEKLRREILRPLYRLAVSVQSHRFAHTQ